MTDIEITREYVQTGLREEIETFTHQALVRVTEDVKDFLPSGRIAHLKASDRMSIQMDEALARIEADPANSGTAIEDLAYLFFARMVAARIEAGAVLGSRSEEMSKPVKKKPAAKTKAAKAAEEKAEEPTPPVTEPEVEPEPVVEVLESNQDFLAQSDEPLLGDAPVETPAEAPADDESIELNKADNGILDLL